MDATLPVINRIYELYKLVVEMNSHAHKRWRYSLCMSVEAGLLQCLETSIMAKNAPKAMKGAYLIKSLAHLEATVLKLRLLLELGAANETKIFQAHAHAREIGNMLGGWLRSLTHA